MYPPFSKPERQKARDGFGRHIDLSAEVGEVADPGCQGAQSPYQSGGYPDPGFAIAQIGSQEQVEEIQKNLLLQTAGE